MGKVMTDLPPVFFLHSAHERARPTSDEDLDSIIAFLHSDDPMLAPTEVEPAGVTQPSLLVKALAYSVMGPLPFPEQPISTPSRAARVASGRY
jgi:hypothetical protein